MPKLNFETVPEPEFETHKPKPKTHESKAQTHEPKLKDHHGSLILPKEVYDSGRGEITRRGKWLSMNPCKSKSSI